jgi:hypothetical protein
MIPLLSIVSGVVGGLFKAVRNSADADTAVGEPSVKLTGRFPGSTTSAVPDGSFAQKFRDHMAKVADSNGDGVISRSELAQQLAKGGVSAAAADQQYKAMDRNGDGQVTVDEFRDATPVPTSPLVQHVLHMLEARRAAAGGTSAS